MFYKRTLLHFTRAQAQAPQNAHDHENFCILTTIIFVIQYRVERESTIACLSLGVDRNSNGSSTTAKLIKTWSRKNVSGLVWLFVCKSISGISFHLKSLETTMNSRILWPGESQNSVEGNLVLRLLAGLITEIGLKDFTCASHGFVWHNL